MNKYLREEWRDSDVPEAIYRRVRDRAWESLQKAEKPQSPMYIFGTLSAATVLVLILVLFTPDAPTTAEEITSLPLPNERVLDSLVLLPRSEPWPVALETADPDQSLQDRIHLSEEVLPSAGAATAAARISTPPEQRTARQLVLHFRLPKTGTRMMWILTKEGL